MNTATRIAHPAKEGSRISEKRDGKKRALAQQTLKTLSQLGYARTSLRDIADRSGVSLGILHYYFEDKSELISYCVHLYKDDFVGNLDAVVAARGTRESIIEEFCNRLAAAVEDEPETHRLWYDLRGQALFDGRFNPVVAELEKAMIALCERLLQRVEMAGHDPLDVYLRFDGLFRYHLQRRLAGDPSAVADFRAALAVSVRSLDAS